MAQAKGGGASSGGCAQCLCGTPFDLVFSHPPHLYIHSFKVGRVGDEELFDVMHFRFTPVSLRLKPKGATLLKNPVSLVLQNSLRLSPWLTSQLPAVTASIFQRLLIGCEVEGQIAGGLDPSSGAPIVEALLLNSASSTLDARVSLAWLRWFVGSSSVRRSANLGRRSRRKLLGLLRCLLHRWPGLLPPLSLVKP